MKLDIYGDNISYVTDVVSTIPIEEANLNEENRIKFVTDVAAISRGRYESKNHKARYDALLTEAAQNTPSRPLEFLPIVLYVTMEFTSSLETHIVLKDDEMKKMDTSEFINKIGKFSYLESSDTSGNTSLEQYKKLYTKLIPKCNVYAVYTNMRCLLNAGIDYNLIPYNTKKELTDFKVLRAKVPMFVFAQFPATHTQITSEAQSDRVSTQEDYWLPSDIFEKLEDEENKKKIKNISTEVYKILYEKVHTIPDKHYELMYSFLYEIPQHLVQQVLKEIGYHKEIYQRAPYYFKYKEVVFGGWSNNPYVWEHAFIERNAKPEVWKNWTQKETSRFVQCCREVIEGK